MAEMCKIHADVPYIVREGTSVHGGHIGWGCAVCNMLKLEEARKRIRELEAALLWTMEEWFGDNALASLGEKISLADEGPEPVRELVERAQQTSAVRRIAESERKVSQNPP